jgi:hypothetical protein
MSLYFGFLLLQSQRNSANLHWGKWRMANIVFGWNLSTDCTCTANSGRKLAFHSPKNSLNI